MKAGKPRKAIAVFFLIIFSVQFFLPLTTYALTSGPSQPEMSKFAPAGNTDFVDLFTGDFKYNIPLLDVGGYPVNLSYQSGTGMEEEASWVGMGWTLNPGAVNRNMRGLPDDFDGDKGDKVEKIVDQEDFKKVGGSVTIKPSIIGWETGALSGNLKLNVYKDNMYGMGASIGAGVSVAQSLNSNSSLTAGLGVDVNSDVRDGVTLSPSVSITNSSTLSEDDYVSQSLSGSLRYNSRSGLKEISLSESFSVTERAQNEGSSASYDRSVSQYFGQAYTPVLNNNKKHTAATFNFDLGPSPMGIYIGFGGSGYFYKEELKDKISSAPAYGYMNYVKAQNKPEALLDFNREKDGIFIKSTPAIATPVATHDYFMATGQAGSNQFRPYYSGNYITFDKEYYNKTEDINGGLTIGFANGFKAGARLEYTFGESRTKKWADNDYVDKTSYSLTTPEDPSEEAVYFKRIGERTKSDEVFFANTGGIENNLPYHASKVDVRIKSANSSADAKATLKSRNGSITFANNNTFKKNKREIRTHTFSYLDGNNASKYGLDKSIKSYNTKGAINGEVQYINRINPLTSNENYRKGHHISEITMTDDEGKRMVYGIPVYNTKQEEVTFSAENPGDFEQTRKTGVIQASLGGLKASNDNHFINYVFGREKMFSRTITPPYSNSWLLTGILSQDYVDIKNDGITDDDLGTAVKFNYSRVNLPASGSDKPPFLYKWRAPYKEPLKNGSGQITHIAANYNEGFLTDPKDDKASIVYGEKELWYLHSIESKTMIAFFNTSKREDGLGVKDFNGEKDNDNNHRLQKLDNIKLYSKADWLKNGVNAVPVKVVHFEYDYSLYPSVPNNTGDEILKDPNLPKSSTNPDLNEGKGKLTLKKIWFTFGASDRGQSNPYIFNYDLRLITENNSGILQNPDEDERKGYYAERHSDRWGNYKQPYYNHLVSGQSNLNNSEYPYALQKNLPPDGTSGEDWKNLIDRFVSCWQLNQIETPAGGIIKVQYESDDYAYVQNRKAMQMFFVDGFEGETPGLIKADLVRIKIPEGISTTDQFQKKYLHDINGEELKHLFFKIYTNLDNRGKYEFVNGYAEIDWSRKSQMTFAGNVGRIPVKAVGSGGYSPFSKAGWQVLLGDLPQFAYDNYDNSEVPESDASAAIRSMITSIGNLRELMRTPDQRCADKKFSNQADLSKSMVRLYTPNGKKTGGGARVRFISIEDNWSGMGGGQTAISGQLYKYTTANNSGEEISTGVASYEPSAGNEENPFHEPVNYTENVKWSSDRYHYIEKPYCESYFPAPVVGYSKVTVTATDASYNGDGEATPYTGTIENEFYTAKDFPVIVDDLRTDVLPVKNSLIMRLFTGRSINKVAVSQGFQIELNDMHGKPKAVRIYDRDKNLITSSEYLYNEKDKNASFRQLVNEVDMLKSDDGTIVSKTMATDIDFTTDMRQSITENTGKSLGAYFGGVFLAMLSYGFGALNIGKTEMISHYHAASVAKVIQRYGILKKTITTKYGSTIEAENLVWDEKTGEVILTRTQTEFDKYNYAFTYPAYRAYDQMGSAYQNIAAVFSALSIGADGRVLNYTENDFVPGDEFIVTDVRDIRFWIIRSGDNTIRAIDKDGEFISPGIYKCQVLRSGRRNMLSAGTGTVICMNNPIVNNRIDLSVDQRILDSKAILFKDEWSVPVNPYKEYPTGTICTFSEECLDEFLFSAISKINGTNPYRRGIFSSSEDNFNVGNAISQFAGTSSCLANMIIGNPAVPASNLDFYLNQIHQYQTAPYYRLEPGDIAHFGNYQIIFDEVNLQFNELVNSTEPSENNMWDLLNSEFPQSQRKYFVKNNGDCSYSLMRADGDCANSPGSRTLVSGCSYTSLLKFHIIGINLNTFNCENPVDKPINPYFKAVLGNWHPYSNYVYTINREQKTGNAGQVGGTDIRNSGYYSGYTPFWSFTGGTLINNIQPGQDIPSNDNRWVWSNRSVYYDQKGNEVESVDALQRYGSALFGYQQSVATAVAANARHNEIAFEGFEDYDFDVANGAGADCPLQRHLDFGFSHNNNEWSTTGGKIIADVSHTGNYCLQLTGTVSITKEAGSAAPSSPILDYDVAGRYLLKSNELAKGFAPVQGKKYLLSLWVNDHQPNSNKVQGLTVQLNAETKDLSNITVPVVEGWKRLELSFVGGSNFSLQLGGSLEIDDIRILPNDGQINTYVYNDKNLRLMAQLDENNFATLYEYDEEGTPVRVKKETERGIMTLKENRQSLKHHQ